MAGAPHPLQAALRTVAWATSSVVLLLITAVAALHLLSMARALARTPDPYGDAGMAFVAAYSIAAFAALGVAWSWKRAGPPRPVVQILVVIAVAVGLRFGLAIGFDAPLAGENGVVHRQAVGILEGTVDCCFSHRPMGYPLALATVYSMLGIGPHAIEALNIALAALTTFLVFDIARVAWGPRAAIVAATGYAVMPSQRLMVLPPLTEPLYTMVLAATIRVSLIPGLPAAAALGAALAVAQYIRSTAVALLAPIAVMVLSFGPALHRSSGRIGLTLVAFLIAMAPVIAFNLEQHADVSISTSAYGGWSLFVGANPASDGRFNADDSALFAKMPGDSAWERSQHAGELAMDRILADPQAYLSLQPRKFAVMWKDETYAGAYAFAPAGSAVPRQTSIAWLLSQIFYVPAVALASFAVIRHGRGNPTVLLIGMVIAVVALSHAVLEVHSRYHAYLIPLFLILAAGAATTSWHGRSRSDAQRAARSEIPGGDL